MYGKRYHDEEITVVNKVCESCGKVYSHVEGHPEGCLQCIEDELVRTGIVRGYIYAMGNNVPMVTISKALNISITKLNRMVRQETLSLTPASVKAGLLRCEKCGAPISTGRYCVACASHADTQGMRSQGTVSFGSKMRTKAGTAS